MAKRSKNKSKVSKHETSKDSLRIDNIDTSTVNGNKRDVTNNRNGNRDNKTRNKKIGDGTNNKRVNHPSWYSISDDLTKPVANIPYSVYNGIAYDIYDNKRLDPETGGSCKAKIPGVLVYKYLPWYGNSGNTSALNIAMRGLFAHIRKVNSGRTNYEAPDLMQYIMAMDSIYLRLHEVKRILLTTGMYLARNREIPKALFTAYQVNSVDLIDNYNAYRGQYNLLIAAANSLPVPKAFNLFARRAVMGNAVLTDELDRVTQLIVPIADGYWKYDPTEKTGGAMKFIPYYTVQEMSAVEIKDQTEHINSASVEGIEWVMSHRLEQLRVDIDLLLANQDINIMGGDILKAYEGDVYTLPYLQENEILEFTHDEDFLLQFKNANTFDMHCASYSGFYNPLVGSWNQAVHGNFLQFVGPKNTTSGIPTIWQENGSLLCAAVCKVDTSGSIAGVGATINTQRFGMLDNLILDVDKNPSPELTLEWTRLMMLPSVSRGILSWLPGMNPVICGSEIGLGWLYIVGDAHYAAINKADMEKLPINTQVISQWFQMGSPTYKFSNASWAKSSDIFTILYNNVYPGVQNAFDHNPDSFTICTNDLVVHSAVEGLNYGPRNYPIHTVTYGTMNSRMYKDMIMFSGATPSGHYTVHTALINGQHLLGLHDMAILGLLASSFVKH